MLTRDSVAVLTGGTRKADDSETNVVVINRRQMLPPPISKLAAVDQKSCKMLPNTECDRLSPIT